MWKRKTNSNSVNRAPHNIEIPEVSLVVVKCRFEAESGISGQQNEPIPNRERSLFNGQTKRVGFKNGNIGLITCLSSFSKYCTCLSPFTK